MAEHEGEELVKAQLSGNHPMSGFRGELYGISPLVVAKLPAGSVHSSWASSM